MPIMIGSDIAIWKKGKTLNDGEITYTDSRKRGIRCWVEEHSKRYGTTLSLRTAVKLLGNLNINDDMENDDGVIWKGHEYSVQEVREVNSCYRLGGKEYIFVLK